MHAVNGQVEGRHARATLPQHQSTQALAQPTHERRPAAVERLLQAGRQAGRGGELSSQLTGPLLVGYDLGANAAIHMHAVASTWHGRQLQPAGAPTRCSCISISCWYCGGFKAKNGGATAWRLGAGSSWHSRRAVSKRAICLHQGSMTAPATTHAVLCSPVERRAPSTHLAQPSPQAQI